MLRAFVSKEKKAYCEQSGARGHNNKEENKGAAEVLHLRAQAKFRWRCGDDSKPCQNKNADRKGIPCGDSLSRRLKTTFQRPPNCPSYYERYAEPMARIMSCNPLSYFGHR